MQPEKTLKKLNCGGVARGSLLKGTRWSYISQPERKIHKILTNRHHAGCQKFLTSGGVYYGSP